MKKRLSVLIVAMIAMVLCTGCVMSMGPEELDAAYQLKDVSEYQFEVAADTYLENPFSNTHAAAEYVEAIAVEEGDLRLANTYTYEELVACFKMVAELSESNLGEYFVNGSLGACEKKDTSWTTEKFKTVELEEKSYLVIPVDKSVYDAIGSY